MARVLRVWFCLVLVCVGVAPPAVIPPPVQPVVIHVAQTVGSSVRSVAAVASNAEPAPHLRGQPPPASAHAGWRPSESAPMRSILSTDGSQIEAQSAHPQAWQDSHAPTASANVRGAWFGSWQDSNAPATSTNGHGSWLGALALAAVAGASLGGFWWRADSIRERPESESWTATEMTAPRSIDWPEHSKFVVATLASEAAVGAETMQQLPSDSLADLGGVALPLFVAGGLLAGTFLKAQNSEPKVSVTSDGMTFSDMPDHDGLSEAKEELSVIVDFLRNPEPFISCGARRPEKVLLSGPGDKELMAKAVAGESGVPFLEVISTSDSPEDVFEEAKGKAPCVLFIPLDKPCDDAACDDESDKIVKLPTWSGPRLNEVLHGMKNYKSSGIIFVAATSNMDDVAWLSSSFDMGVSVGYESDLSLGRRLLKANRLEEAVVALTDAAKGGKWRCGCSFCMAFSATDEMKAELSNAQALLQQHWETYHDMRVALPSAILPERSLRMRQSVACSACSSLSGDQGSGGAVGTAGIALADYISKHVPPVQKSTEEIARWRHVNVLELGSGTGIAGIAAASEGADVLMTDKSVLVPLMETNIKLNENVIEFGSADCEAFAWEAPPPKEVSNRTWDIVLGADLVSNSAGVDLFADTLGSLLGPGGAAAGATAIYAHASKPGVDSTSLQSTLRARGLSLMELPSRAGDAALDEVALWSLRSTSV